MDLTILAETRFWLAAALAVLAGLVRGFSGFGAAMIFVPVASALYSPVMAVPILFVFDTVASLPYLIAAFRRCDWKSVAPLTVGAAVTVPLGVYLLVAADPVIVRWIICVLILLVVGVMATGWRYRRDPGIPFAVTVGAASGLSGGFASLYGPPVILFWLGGLSSPALVRYNIFAFFGLISMVTGVSLWQGGLFTAPVTQMALLYIPAYALAIVVGARLFKAASERFFRLFALALCTATALVGLPVWG